MTLDEKSDDFYERSCGSASADTSYTQDVEHISDQSLWSIRNNYSSDSLLSRNLVTEKRVCVDKVCRAETTTDGACQSPLSLEIRSTFWLAWALIFSRLAEVVMQPVATMFTGTLKEDEIVAVGLANTIISALGNNIAQGMSSACDTIFSQIYGSRNNALMGVCLQRALVINLLASMICGSFLLHAEQILILLKQDPHISRLIGRYLLLFIPGLMCLFPYVVLRKFVQCQNLVLPHIAIGLAGLGINTLTQYTFMHQLKFGIDASSLAQVVTYAAMLALTVFYLVASGVHGSTWKGWQSCCLCDWGSFLRLSLFGMLMTCLEWWAYQISILCAGIIGTLHASAQSVIFNIDVIFYAVPSGMAQATSIRVGQLLGSGAPSTAKLAAKVGFITVGLVGILSGVVLASLAPHLPKLFTTSDDVIQMVASILPVCAAYTVFEHVLNMSRGVIRGIGHQWVGFLFIFLAFYILSLPVGGALLFTTDLELKGLWLGFTGSVLITVVLLLCYIMCCCDWKQLAVEARMRAGSTSTAREQFPVSEKTGLLYNRPHCGRIYGEGNERENIRGGGEDGGSVRSLFLDRSVQLTFPDQDGGQSPSMKVILQKSLLVSVVAVVFAVSVSMHLSGTTSTCPQSNITHHLHLDVTSKDLVVTMTPSNTTIQ